MCSGLNRKEEKRLYESPVSLAAKIPSLLRCDRVKTELRKGPVGSRREAGGSAEGGGAGPAGAAASPPTCCWSRAKSHFLKFFYPHYSVSGSISQKMFQ